MKYIIPWFFFGPLVLMIGGTFAYWATASPLAGWVAAAGLFTLAAVMIFAFVPNLVFFCKRHGGTHEKQKDEHSVR